MKFLLFKTLQQIREMDFAEWTNYLCFAYGNHNFSGAHSLTRAKKIYEHRTDSGWLWKNADEIHTLVFRPENWE